LNITGRWLGAASQRWTRAAWDAASLCFPDDTTLGGIVDWMRLFELALALDWPHVATAVVGALAVLGGQGLTGRQQARDQHRLERYQERLEGQRRRERAAQVLADVTALLADAEAIRISGTILKA
jgi:hypothetical protein